jgi:hypothetical protein
MNNFQAESKKAGDEFEDIVEAHLNSLGTVMYKNYTVPNTGVEVDFVHMHTVSSKEMVLELVEAKGGNAGDKKRPGAERTDNVKKAVANGAILKFVHPNIRYIVYFSAKPKPGSYGDHMLQVALDAGYIDEIKYL